MLLIGLTGSIATGKSTVSSLLSSPPYNIPIIDADLLARKVVEPGTAGYQAIVNHFGPSTPDLLVPVSTEMPERGKDGKDRPLDRAALGRRVFGTGEDAVRERGVLNGIVHPAVRWEMYKALWWAYVSGNWAVVLDIPLLFEAGLDTLCGTVIVAAVHDPKTQMDRLMARDPHLSVEDAENRVKSQGDVREKARRCLARGEARGVVVWNDGSREELEGRVEEVILELKQGSPSWWGWLLLVVPGMGMLAGGFGIARNVLINREWKRTEMEVAKGR